MIVILAFLTALCIGISTAQAQPEPTAINVGDIVQLRITDSSEYDLVGAIVGEE